jgi:Ca2+-binding RTX toxin-like protein
MGDANFDWINGEDGDDFILAGDGDASISGGTGNDVIIVGGVRAFFQAEGNEGNDTIVASSSVDHFGFVTGGDGDDMFRLFATAGGNVMARGDAGRDTFVIDGNRVNNGYLDANVGLAEIEDFAVGDSGDILSFNLLLLKNYEDGSPFGTGHLRLVQTGSSLLFQVDADADGSEYGFITVAKFFNTQLAAITATNLGGYALDGATPSGKLIDGTPDDDSLAGGLGRDTMNGNDGNDGLSGGDGNDSLSGGTGSDFLDGQLGLDTLDGGDGDDFLFDWQTGGVVMAGGAGNDTAWVSTLKGYTALVDGGAGDDTLNGFLSGGQISVNGGVGDDLIDMFGWNPGSVTATGGAGRDTYRMIGPNGEGMAITDFTVGDGGDIIDVTDFITRMGLIVPGGNPFVSGQLRLVQSGSDTQIQFSWGGGGTAYMPLFILQNVDATGLTAANFGGVTPDGQIDGTDASEALSGGAGNDVINGLGGNDTLSGGHGNDTVYGGNGGDGVSGGDGDDSMSGQLGDDTLVGGAGNDVLYDYDGTDLFDGGDGDDNLFFRGNSATLTGGQGNDTIIAGGSVDTIVNAGTGDDFVVLEARTASVTLGDGRDVIMLLNQSYTSTTPVITDFQAGKSGDILYVPNLIFNYQNYVAGTDPFVSGFFRWIQSGADAVLQTDFDGPSGPEGFRSALTLKNVNVADLTAWNFAAVSASANGEALVGVDYDSSDTIDGLGGDDWISGLKGPDVLSGNDGSDTLCGGFGNDTLLGGSRWDTLVGGDGDDSLDGGTDNDQMTGGIGNDSYVVDHVGDRVYENVGEGVDAVRSWISYSLTANVETLLLSGTAVSGTGNGLSNRIEATSGNNILSGGLGNDSLYGWDGNDSLTGGNDHDRLSGGNGSDTLIGGHGQDQLGGGAGADDFVFSSTAVNGHDHILDFQHGMDRLVFAASDYGFVAGHVLTAAQFTVGSTAVGATAQFIWDESTDRLYWDADGTGAGTAFELAIVTGDSVTKDDLLFV